MPAVTVRSGQPGCSTPGHTPTSPSRRAALPHGRALDPARSPFRRGKAHPVHVLLEEAQASGPELRLRASVKIDRYDFGVTSLKGLAAGISTAWWMSSPPALSRADIEGWEAAHGRDRVEHLRKRYGEKVASTT